MRDSDMARVKGYIDCYFSEPRAGKRDYIFAHQSYTRWAACVIMERMLKQPSRPTAEIIEWFAREMDWFSGMRDGKSDQYMWCAAADAAWYMLDLYLDDERKDKYDKYLNNC